MKDCNCNAHVIAKIERADALINIDEMITIMSTIRLLCLRLRLPRLTTNLNNIKHITNTLTNTMDTLIINIITIRFDNRRGTFRENY